MSAQDKGEVRERRTWDVRAERAARTVKGTLGGRPRGPSEGVRGCRYADLQAAGSDGKRPTGTRSTEACRAQAREVGMKVGYLLFSGRAMRRVGRS